MAIMYQILRNRTNNCSFNSSEGSEQCNFVWIVSLHRLISRPFYALSISNA